MAPGLARQTVPILLKGLDQKAPRQTGVTGALDTLQNMILRKAINGEGYEFVPRPGVGPLAKTADAGTISSGMRLGTLGAGLVLLTGTGCYRHAVDEWHRVSATAPVVGVDTKPITLGSAAVTSCDEEYVNGFTVAAYVVNDPVALTTEVRYSLTDSNGAPVVSDQRISFGVAGSAYERVRVVVSGTKFAVCFYNGAFAIPCFIYDTATPTALPISVTVTSSATNVFDIQTVGSNGTIAVGWIDNVTGQFNQRLVTVSNGTMSSTTAYASLTNLLRFSYLTNTFSSNTLYIGHVTAASGLRVTTFDGSTLALGTTTVYDATVTAAYNIAGYRAGAAVSVFVTSTFVDPWNARIRVSTGGAATTVIRSLVLASRVASMGGNLYALARYAGQNQSLYFLLDLTNGVVVGKALQGLATESPQASFVGSQYANLAVSTGNTLLTSSLRIVAVDSGGGTFAASVGAASIAWTFQDATVGKPVELNGVLNIPGAQPYVYDGSVLVEHGFPIVPEQFGLSSSVGAGGLTPGATYTYRMVFAWTDAAGNLWRSAPTITPGPLGLGGSDNTVTLTIPTLRVTRKTGVIIEVYRTLANGDGSVYFKVTSATSPLPNDPTVDSVTFVDTVSDAAAESGEPLYSPNDNTTSVLANIAPPGCRTMATHRGRLLIGAVEGDPDAIWFSKDVVPGFGVEFSDFLVSRIQSTEPVTAVGSLDSYAVACTTTQSWGSINEYPDDTGAGGVLIFQQQSNTTGCATIGLLGRNDLGLMTYGGAGKGVWRSSRGLTWDYVGAPVEDDVAAMTPVAILSVPGQNQMRVVGGNTAVAFESIYGTWATWNYLYMPAPIVDATIWNGRVAYLCSDGTVEVEDTANFDDLDTIQSNPVAHLIKLSGLNLAGVGGFWRLYLTHITGRMVGDGNGFTLNFAQEFDGTPIPNKSFVYTGSNDELDVQVDPGTAGKSSRYDLTIFDSANGSNSAFTLAAVTALIGTKAGLSKLPPARRAT